MSTLVKISAITFFLMLASGCAQATDPVFPTETYTAPITAEPNPPTETPQPPPTRTPAPTATPTPYHPFKAVTWVDNLLLRSGPGFLHDAYWTYPQGEVVEVLGRAPGWSWVYVHTSNNLLGWMKIELLEPEMSFYYAPELTPEGYVIVKGHVYTPNGNPASHITLSLMPKDGEPADSDAATTDALGQFFFFLPEGSRGIWTLAANAYGCESNAVTSACNLIGQFPAPLDIDVQAASEVWYNLQMTNP